MRPLHMTAEVVVFLVIGLACLAHISVRLGKLELPGKKYYTLTAQFDSAAGLKREARVEIAGVEIGKVDRIILDPANGSRAVVYMKIRREIKITDDVIASIRTSGLLGDKFVTLSPGGSENALSDNGKIYDTESSIDMLRLLEKFINRGTDGEE